MIIKTVLFLTVVSIIGKYEGVHCFLDDYLASHYIKYELFKLKCHFAIYNVIKKETYGYNPDNDEYNVTKKNEMKIYMFRLYRIYNNNYDSLLKEIAAEIWGFYKFFIDWIRIDDTPRREIVMKKVDALILMDIWPSGTRSFEEDYEQCNKILMLFSKPTEEYIVEKLSQIFYEQGDIYKNTVTDIYTDFKLPVSIEYGFILLLLNEGEIEKFMSSTEYEKSIFVLDMIHEVLKNIFYIMESELMKFKKTMDYEISLIHDSDDPSIMRWTIINRIFMKIVKATTVVLKIQVIGGIQRNVNLIKEYKTFAKMALAKKDQLNTGWVKDCEQKEQKQNEDPTPAFSGRLTNNNSIRVPIFQCIIPFMVENEPLMRVLQNSDNNIQLLLDVHGWIVNIIKYADFMIFSSTADLKAPINWYQQLQLNYDESAFYIFLKIPELPIKPEELPYEDEIPSYENEEMIMQNS